MKNILYVLVALLLFSCNRTGEIKVKNNISRTTLENIYWGDTYIGGALKPGEETEYKEITRFDDDLPATNRIFFSTGGLFTEEYYTEEEFTLEKKGQLFIELTDSTVIVELN